MADEQPQILSLSKETPQQFFRELLLAAMQNQRARVQEETEFYLVNLLTDFLDSELLYVRDESGRAQERPLAFLLKEALEEQGPARLQLLRRLGDKSLLVSGFFPDSLARSLVDVDYYIAMGERAYDALGGEVARQSRTARGSVTVHRGVFDELAEKFKLLVDLLNEVSERTLVNTNAGLVRLYDRFLKTGSARLAGLLRAQGALPATALSAPIKGRFVQ